MKKRVLIFTYYWPPAGGVAVQRFLKFSKYLPEFGWEPIIVTVKNGSYPYYDESLKQEVSLSLKVYHTKTSEPFEFYNLLKGKKGKTMPVVSVGSHGTKSFFQHISEYVRANYFIPDARKGWLNYAVRQAEEILKTEKIDVIITTGPPHSTHLIGLELKKKYGIKWLADFRDPWTGIFYNAILPRTESTKQKDKALETEVLKNADCVTVISAGMKKEFESVAEKIEVISNGYDDTDFTNSRGEGEGRGAREDKFILRYVGNLMASENVEVLWRVLSEFRISNFEFRIELIGRTDDSVKQSITKNGIADIVSYRDFVDHREAIKLMQEASLLLFVIPDVKGNELIITGKLFEYLASKSEIISFGPVEGNAAEILEQTGRKKMLDYRDEHEAKKQLEGALNYYNLTKTGFKYSDGKHQVFSRKNQAGKLAENLNEITS